MTRPIPVARCCMESELNLEYFAGSARDSALAYLAADDVDGFLQMVGNDYGIAIQAANAGLLKSRGLLERGIVRAMISPRTNLLGDYADVCFSVGVTDRKRLRAVGEPLPGSGHRTIYRGVSGCGRSRLSGYSCTLSLEMAAWFARRWEYETSSSTSTRTSAMGKKS